MSAYWNIEKFKKLSCSSLIILFRAIDVVNSAEN